MDEIAGFSNTRLSNNVDFRPEADVYIEVDLYFCLMIQQLLIALLFAAALFYLGRMGWRAWRAKNACSTGCGKCSVADMGQMAKNIEKAGKPS